MATLVDTPAPRAGRLGVFADNRRLPIHRWYPFIEGFSSELVHRTIVQTQRAESIFDPFGGSGTTSLAAATAGKSSYFTEVNPYMAWLADVKVNQSQLAASSNDSKDRLLALASQVVSGKLKARPVDIDHPLLQLDERREFFPADVARQAVAIIAAIPGEVDGPLISLARVALASSLVPASNMLRRTDLRRRRDGEAAPQDLLALFAANLRMIAEDLAAAGLLAGSAEQIGVDAKGGYSDHAPFDLIVTSPPYLNGTNYGRNTKIELIALEFMQNESELEGLRNTEITAGINNVAKRNGTPKAFEEVEEVASQLELNTYDRRIPEMIRGYFSDMFRVFESVRQESASHASFVLDIGDSRYSGVHVKTDELLVQVAQRAGWACLATELIRERRSYDGSRLSQRLLTFGAA